MAAANDINAHMHGHAVAAVEMVHAEYGRKMDEAGLKMDFSEKTIGLVESILNGFAQDQEAAETLFPKVALLFGAYIGEMIRNCIPDATWVPAPPGSETGSPHIEVVGIQVFPLTWCYKRLYNGPAHNVTKKYLAFRKAFDQRQ
jgi:hypothetical protein